eukprot:6391280-Prorocentrum_lima.AAC.1
MGVVNIAIRTTGQGVEQSGTPGKWLHAGKSGKQEVGLTSQKVSISGCGKRSGRGDKRAKLEEYMRTSFGA